MIDKLRAGYRSCARLTWRHGKTYYWGAALLPHRQRCHVHAVYALCRLADDIVDVADPDHTDRAAELRTFRDRFRNAVMADTSDPVLAAISHTIRTRSIPMECFDRFFTAMETDLTQSQYQTWEDLCGYMEGSAAVIGEMMLPVLEPRSTAARGPARALGMAFQLTNFLRDIDEDLDRRRIYLPQEDLRRFGVDIHSRTATLQWRRLMAFEIARNRTLYNEASDGIAMLPRASARCVSTAHVLYSRILQRIEAADYDVFGGRVAVPIVVKAATTARIRVFGPPRIFDRESEGADDHQTKHRPATAAVRPQVRRLGRHQRITAKKH
jgi:phytoene synthase